MELKKINCKINKRANECPERLEHLVVVIKKKQKVFEELNIIGNNLNINQELVINFEELDFTNEKIINNLKNANLIQNFVSHTHLSNNRETIEVDGVRNRVEFEKMKICELKELIENLSFHLKIHFHWSWLQLKKDLIQILIDPKNEKFKKKK